LIGDPLRHVLLSTLSGADEKDKLNRVFKSAPPWLLWFTFADYSAKLLGLSLPDLSTVRRFERSKEIFHAWWGLPQSAFECRPWQRALANSARANPGQQIEWPRLISEELLRLDLEDAMSLLREAGHFGREEERHPEFCGTDVTPRRTSGDY
jgi:hypothetical protein